MEEAPIRGEIVRGQNRQIMAQALRETNGELANFSLIPLRKICYRNRDGAYIVEKEKIELQIRLNGGALEMMEVFTKDLDKLPSLVTRRFSSAILNFNEPNAEKILVADFRSRTQNLPVITCLTDQGWQFYDNIPYYVHDKCPLGSNVLIKTGVELPFRQDFVLKDVADVFFKSTKLYNGNDTLSPMLLFSFQGILHRLFRDAGYEPHYLLFINGRTGSMKTTLAKILFSQMCSPKFRNKPRRIDADTEVSFERAIVKSGYDTVLLFDDYAPAKTPQRKRIMQDKLETIVRMVGDGSTKSRSDGELNDNQGEGVHGAVVITGELIGKGESSNLRCLYCEMQREKVNVEMVSWFQSNSFAYTTLLFHFSSFVAEKWNYIKNYIASNFEKERKKVIADLEKDRLADSAVNLLITADIVALFLKQYCLCNPFFNENLIQKMKEGVIECAHKNKIMTQEENYSCIFLRGIHALMSVNKISLYNGKMQTDHIKVYDGFEDEEFFYFLPEITYAKTSAFLQQSRQYLPFDLREMVLLLFEDGIIKSYPNGRNKVTYYARIPLENGVKQKFLKIKKDIFRKVVDEGLGEADSAF